MAFEDYKPNKTRAQSLYAVPMRMCEGVMMVKRSDVPDRFRDGLDAFCDALNVPHNSTYVMHEIFHSFIEVEEAFFAKQKQ